MKKTCFELDELHAGIVKMAAETVKLNAETIKISTENKWYPFVAGAVFTGAVVALTKLFL